MDNVKIEVKVSAGNGKWEEDKKVEVTLESEHTIDMLLLDNQEIRELVRNELISEFSTKFDIVLENAIEKMKWKLGIPIEKPQEEQPKAGE